MKKKLYFLVGVGVGYVLGSRAGRERYEQMKTSAVRLVRSPAPQHAAGGPTSIRN